MTVTVTAITETCNEIEGIRNTAGELEIYRVISIGHNQFNVLVQRTNGKFACLNNNKHQYTIDRVISEMKKA